MRDFDFDWTVAIVVFIITFVLLGFFGCTDRGPTGAHTCLSDALVIPDNYRPSDQFMRWVFYYKDTNVFINQHIDSTGAIPRVWAACAALTEEKYLRPYDEKDPDGLAAFWLYCVQKNC